MRWLVWTVRLVIFLVVLALALKNTVMVPVTLFFGLQWEVSLVLLLLIALIAGSLLGVMAMLGRVWHLNREIAGLKKQIRTQTIAEADAKAAD